MKEPLEDVDGGGGYVKFSTGDIFCLSCHEGQHRCCVVINVLHRTYTCECTEAGCLDRYYGIYCRHCNERLDSPGHGCAVGVEVKVVPPRPCAHLEHQGIKMIPCGELAVEGSQFCADHGSAAKTEEGAKPCAAYLEGDADRPCPWAAINGSEFCQDHGESVGIFKMEKKCDDKDCSTDSPCYDCTKTCTHGIPPCDQPRMPGSQFCQGHQAFACCVYKDGKPCTTVPDIQRTYEDRSIAYFCLEHATSPYQTPRATVDKKLTGESSHSDVKRTCFAARCGRAIAGVKYTTRGIIMDACSSHASRFISSREVVTREYAERMEKSLKGTRGQWI